MSGALLKFGTVSEVDPKGFVRVKFVEDDIVSGLLGFVFRRTFKDKEYMLPEVGDHVACLMDCNCEDGICIGAIYSEADIAPYDDANKSGIVFQNGDVIEYDKEQRTYHIKTDTTEFFMKPAGFALKKGDESLKAIVADMLAQIKLLTFANGAGTTGPPINLAAFTAIETRVDTFFES